MELARGSCCVGRHIQRVSSTHSLMSIDTPSPASQCLVNPAAGSTWVRGLRLANPPKPTQLENSQPQSIGQAEVNFEIAEVSSVPSAEARYDHVACVLRRPTPVQLFEVPDLAPVTQTGAVSLRNRLPRYEFRRHQRRLPLRLLTLRQWPFVLSRSEDRRRPLERPTAHRKERHVPLVAWPQTASE
jgi:hypothetical protein